MPRRHAPLPSLSSPWQHLGRVFLTGLLTVLPVIGTLYFALWVLSVLEKFFGKQVLLVIPDDWYHTGMGLVVAVVFVFLWAEKMLLEIPLVRSVYGALRDLLGLFAQHKEPSLQVVSLDLPGNLRLLGFVTRSDFSDAPPGIARGDEVAVYLPMSYQIGGYTVFVPRSACKPVEMSREEAMKFILTAGLKSASPSEQPASAGYAGRRPS
jgi:uncharacterized membrane protein